MLLATAFFNTLIASAVTLYLVLAYPQRQALDIWPVAMLFSYCIGYTIHGLFYVFYLCIGETRRKALSPLASWVIHIGISGVGVVLGYSLGFALHGQNFLMALWHRPSKAGEILLLGLIAVSLRYVVAARQARTWRAQTEKAQARQATAELEKQAADARLRMLQAQIEPHFLFNTLANVQALIDYEPARARHMLASFIDYLRYSLDASRRTHATLGDELALLDSYLQVMQVRLGERLHYTLDVPPVLQAHPFAPLLLQPLVENAIKYGIEPQVAGGSVTVRATQAQGRVTITVQDQRADARTVPSKVQPGTGAGLANVRVRLQATLGANAALSIAETQHGYAVEVTFDAQL